MTLPVRTPALRIEVSTIDDIRVVALIGRLDQTLEGLLGDALEQLLERNLVRIVVNLRGLDYLNSRGVSAFIAAVDQLREAGGDLKIAAAPAQAQLVLERLGVHRLIQQFATPEEAVAAFAVPIQDCLFQGGLDVFIAGGRGRTYHASSCSGVKRLKTVMVLASKKAARDAGLTPCSRCCT